MGRYESMKMKGKEGEVCKYEDEREGGVGM